MLCQVGGGVQSHNNAYEDWSIGSKDYGKNFKSDQRNCKAKEKNQWHVKRNFQQMERNSLLKRFKNKETMLFKMDNYDLFVIAFLDKFFETFTMQ